MNILLADDDKIVLETVGRFLSARGHGLQKASGGTEALRRMAKEIPDLVISDIGMPGMDGVKLLRAVRERFPGLPVVLMTGRATVETAVAALRNGAFDYLKKPIDLEELQACLARMEGRRR